MSQNLRWFQGNDVSSFHDPWQLQLLSCRRAEEPSAPTVSSLKRQEKREKNTHNVILNNKQKVFLMHIKVFSSTRDKLKCFYALLHQTLVLVEELSVKQAFDLFLAVVLKQEQACFSEPGLDPPSNTQIYWPNIPLMKVPHLQDSALQPERLWTRC